MAVAQAFAGTSQDIQNSQSQSMGRRFAAAVKKFFSPPKEMKLQSESKALLQYLAREDNGKRILSIESFDPLNVVDEALLAEIASAYIALRKPSKADLEQKIRADFAGKPEYADLSRKEFNAKVDERLKNFLAKRAKEKGTADEIKVVASYDLQAQIGSTGHRARNAAMIADMVRKAIVVDASAKKWTINAETWRTVVKEKIEELDKLLANTKAVEEKARIADFINFLIMQMKKGGEGEIYAKVAKSVLENSSSSSVDSVVYSVYDYYAATLSLSEKEKEKMTKALNLFDKLFDEKNHKAEIEALASFQIRGHRWREAFYVIGKICSILFALGCGFTTAGALMLVLPGMPIVFPVFVFIAGFLVNYALTSQSTPNTFAYLRQMFVEQFLKFSLPKKIFVACSALFCLSAGIVAAVFAYTGAIAIAATLGLVSAAFPPIFMVVAVVSALCIAAVMFRGILAASNGNILEKIRNFFTSTFKPRNLVIRDAWGVEREYPETRGRYIVRMIMTVALSAVFFLVASLGCVFNMDSGYQVLTEMLMKTQLFVMAAAQVLGMLPSIFAALGETQFHAQVAKDNAKTLTVKIPELIQTAKEVLDGRRSANKGLIAARIVLAIVMMKIILLNIIGNAFPAAIGGGMVGGPELSCPLTVMESALDTMDDWLIQMKSVLKGLTIIANAIATAFRSIVDRIKGKKSSVVVPKDDDKGGGPDLANAKGAAAPQNPGAGPGGAGGSAGALLSQTPTLLVKERGVDGALDVDSVAMMSRALSAVAVAHVVTENALEEAMVTKRVEAPVVTISTEVPVSSLSIFKKASVVPANTSCRALELPEALSSAAAVAA